MGRVERETGNVIVDGNPQGNTVVKWIWRFASSMSMSMTVTVQCFPRAVVWA